MRKSAAKSLMIIGLMFIILGLVPITIKYSQVGYFFEWEENKTYDNGDKIIIHGDVISTGNATDELFGVTVKSPILIRNVEMVQWTEGVTGGRMILANYPIKSFELDGKTYENPEFPIKSEVFYGTAEINGLALDKNYFSTLIPDMYENYGTAIRKTDLTELPEYFGDVDVVLNKDSYVTASDDWEIGDIRITYQYVKDIELKDFTICGIVDNTGKSSKLMADRSKPLIFNNNFTLTEIQNRILGSLFIYYVPIAIGSIIFIFGAINLKFKKKSNE